MVTARRLDRSVSCQRGCSISAWIVAGTSTVRVGRSSRDRRQRRIGRKARMDRHRRAELQRRRGLDVEPADMEQRQHGEHVIVGGQVVHVLAHHRVPDQRLLAQHRALRPAGGARGVDHEQRTRRDRYAGCGRRRCRRRADRSNETPPAGAKSSPTTLDVGQRLAAAAAITAAKLSSTTSAFTEASRQDEDLLGHREPPVERHQHGAEPRAGIEQDQIVGMIGGEDRHAIAAADAELAISARARRRRCARRRPHRSACGPQTGSRSCRA